MNDGEQSEWNRGCIHVELIKSGRKQKMLSHKNNGIGASKNTNNNTNNATINDFYKSINYGIKPNNSQACTIGDKHCN